jgi:hypothetical protein
MVALNRWNEHNSNLPPPVGFANITTILFSKQLLDRGIPPPFALMIYRIRGFSCFDPRDRVYGLLGLHSIGTLGRVWICRLSICAKFGARDRTMELSTIQ